MTEQQMIYFLTVIEEGSISKAARKLFISQPSLTQAIKRMEDEIGNKLFDRSIKPIRLTCEGKICMEAAEKMRAIKHEMEEQLKDNRQEVSGTLKVGITTFRLIYMMPLIYPEFSKKYPNVELEFIERSTNELEELLLEGKIDICFATTPIYEPLFSSVSFVRERIFLAVPRSFHINKVLQEYQIKPKDIEKRELKTVSLKRFKKEKFIFQRPDHHMTILTKQLFHKCGITPNIAMEASSVMFAMNMVHHEVACAFVSDLFINAANIKEHPIYYRIAESEKDRESVILFKKNRYLSKSAKVFIEVVQSVYSLAE